MQGSCNCLVMYILSYEVLQVRRLAVCYMSFAFFIARGTIRGSRWISCSKPHVLPKSVTDPNSQVYFHIPLYIPDASPMLATCHAFSTHSDFPGTAFDYVLSVLVKPLLLFSCIMSDGDSPWTLPPFPFFIRQEESPALYLIWHFFPSTLFCIYLNISHHTR